MTKVLILADIHANLAALQAVLEALSAHVLDTVLCAGDMVGYGSRPNECLDILRDLDALCIRGNHERFVLGIDDGADFSDEAWQSGVWTREVLTAENRAYLEGLQDEITLEDGTVIAHGAPGDPDRYLFGCDELQAVAEQQRTEHGGGLTLIGHTHQSILASADQVRRPGCSLVKLEPGTRYVLNPGSVGYGRLFSESGSYAVWERERGEVFFSWA